MKEGITLKFKYNKDVKTYLKGLNKPFMYKVQPILVIKEDSNIGTNILKTSFESIIITDNKYHIKYFDMVIEDYFSRYDTNNYTIIGYELYINILTNNKFIQENEKKKLIEKYESKLSRYEKGKRYLSKKIKEVSTKIYK